MTNTLYNEIDPAACAILQEQISRGVIANGRVDSRSIKDLKPDDLDGIVQAHFFAGGGFWSVAARMAGWPDDKPLWTASCPCQPFSAAGKGLGTDDPRHLWPDLFRLVRACRPAILVGEQVAGTAGYNWFDGVSTDLEGEGYACRAVNIPACAINAPHKRQRLYWVAVDNTSSKRLQGHSWNVNASRQRLDDSHRLSSSADDCEQSWLVCHDGKARRTEPSIRLLAHGVPRRVDLWRVGGNAIVPTLAAEVLRSLL